MVAAATAANPTPAAVGTLLAAALGFVALAPLLNARRLQRMDIPATLRVVE